MNTLTSPPGGDRRPDPYNALALGVLAVYTAGGALATHGDARWTYVAMLALSLTGMGLALFGRHMASGLHAMVACALYPIVGLWTPEGTTSALSEVLWMVVVPGLGSVIVPLRAFVPTSLSFLGVILFLLWRNPELPAAAAIEAGLGVTLITVLGTIAAAKLERKRQGLLAEVAERRRREERLQEYSTELELLGTIGRHLVTNPALPDTLSSLCRQIREQLDLELVSIYLRQEDGGLRHLASDGYPVPPDLVIRPGQASVLMRCASEGRPIYERDVLRATGYLPGSDLVHSEYVVPLQVGSRLLGALNLESTRLDGFEDSTRDMLQRAGYLFAVALEREEMFDALVAARDDLVRANTQLEERVAQRTAELVDEVAERKRTEQDLLAANRELEGMQQRLVQLGKLAAVGELGAGIAHELNQPLTAIELFAESLRKEPSRRIADCAHELEIIQEQGRRMAQLVDNLRAFSRRSSIRLQRLPVGAALDDALTLLQQPLSLASVEVDRLFPPDLPDVHGDPVLLQQVFVNLLTNAMQALESAPAEKPRRVAVSAETVGDSVRYTFQDNGPGIPADLEGRIFEPFFTTRDDRGGTGLGLPLSARIVQRHGGELTYAGSDGEGARFRLSLPVWKRQTEPEPQPRKAPQPTEDAGRVLAVDDEQVVLFGLQRLVKAWGWELTPASSAAQALEALDGASFDVALVDLRMPGVSGLELIERLAELAPQIRVVAMSGYLSEENRLALEALGVHQVLPKPVPSERLRATLTSALHERQGPQATQATEAAAGPTAGPPAGEADRDAGEDTRDDLSRSWLHADTPPAGWSRFLDEGNKGGEGDEDDED